LLAYSFHLISEGEGLAMRDVEMSRTFH